MLPDSNTYSSSDRANFKIKFLNFHIRIYPETSGSDEIKFIYDATGTKWQKIYTTSSNTEKTTYCNNFIYKGEVSNMELEKILHPEGLIELEETEYKYTYFLKDHLGNTRAVITDADGDGYLDNNNDGIIQTDDYYPFGMSFSDGVGGDIKYCCSGKEIQDDGIGGVGLDDYDYGSPLNS